MKNRRTPKLLTLLLAASLALPAPAVAAVAWAAETGAVLPDGYTGGEDVMLMRGTPEDSVELDISGQGVPSLDGIEFPEGLKKLIANHNKISSLEPLTGLTSLAHLELQDNIISDITPLSELQSLTYLNLSENKITNITDLEKLGCLTELNLSNNSITNIFRLDQLSELTKLDLSNNAITDIVGFDKLNQLKELYLSGNQIEEIGILPQSLEVLALNNNGLTDISELSSLTLLSHLEMENNDISNISSLTDLLSLTYLDLSDNAITDIGYLGAMDLLTELDLSNNAITDINYLGIMKNLEELDLDGNYLTEEDLLTWLPNNFKEKPEFETWLAKTVATQKTRGDGDGGEDGGDTDPPDTTPDTSARDDDGDYYGTEKWNDLKRRIAAAEEGDTITFSATGLPHFPSSVARELKGRDITLEVRKNGVTYRVNGLEIGAVDKIWYEFENMEEQLLTSGTPEAVGEGEKQNPATGR